MHLFCDRGLIIDRPGVPDLETLCCHTHAPDCSLTFPFIAMDLSSLWWRISLNLSTASQRSANHLGFSALYQVFVSEASWMRFFIIQKQIKIMWRADCMGSSEYTYWCQTQQWMSKHRDNSSSKIISILRHMFPVFQWTGVAEEQRVNLLCLRKLWDSTSHMLNVSVTPEEKTCIEMDSLANVWENPWQDLHHSGDMSLLLSKLNTILTCGCSERDACTGVLYEKILIVIYIYIYVYMGLKIQIWVTIMSLWPVLAAWESQVQSWVNDPDHSFKHGLCKISLKPFEGRTGYLRRHLWKGKAKSQL